MLAIGVTDSLYMFYDNRPLVEKLMDILLAHQEKVMRAVFDRFGDDLALVMVNDDIGHNSGLLISPKMFLQIFPHRMKRLIAPAKDHGLKVLMHTDGKLDGILPILYDIGIDANHPIEPESNDIVEVKKKWAGQDGADRQRPHAAAGLRDEGRDRGQGQGVLREAGAGRRLGAAARPPASWTASRRRTSWR